MFFFLSLSFSLSSTFFLQQRQFDSYKIKIQRITGVLFERVFFFISIGGQKTKLSCAGTRKIQTDLEHSGQSVGLTAVVHCLSDVLELFLKTSGIGLGDDT